MVERLVVRRRHHFVRASAGARWSALLALSLVILVASPVRAQEDLNDSCPLIVDQALDVVGDACRFLGRNEACYGHVRVKAEFWEPRAGLSFDAPEDQVALIDLRRLQSLPLDAARGEWGVAVLNLQADLPETLPGQAVTFLLMGDAALENAVAPDAAAESARAAPASGVTTVGVNLRRAPATTADVVTALPQGSRVTVIGVDSRREWVQVALDTGGAAWVWGDLITLGAGQTLAALPITDGTAAPAGFRPMQAFYFSAGMGMPACREAPNALVVQNPANTRVTFNVNGMDVALGSTVVFTAAQLPPAATGTRPTDLLVITLIEGNLEARTGGFSAGLDRGGETLAVTLNRDGLVDAASTLVDPAALGGASLGDAIERAVVRACLNAMASGVFPRSAACRVDVAYQSGGAGGGARREVYPVYHCEYLGDDQFQWYRAAVTYQGGAPVQEEIIGGPFTGPWQPGCPDAGTTGAGDAGEGPSGPAEPPPTGPH